MRVLDLAVLLAATLSLAPPAFSQTFNGYDCTVDCSGHQAGYDWAERNDITDPDDCSGNSESFIEGCKSYAEENGGSDDDPE